MSISPEGNSDSCSCSTLKSLSSGKSVVDVLKIQSWMKGLSALANFTFVHLHHYSVNSKAYTLKANKYLADGYIQNVWAGEPQERDDTVVIRCHCFSSLKANKVYVVFQVMFFQPHAHALKGSVRHATPLQLSCCTWKISIDTVTSIYLPTDTAATDHLQHGMFPLRKTSRLGRLNMARMCFRPLLLPVPL